MIILALAAIMGMLALGDMFLGKWPDVLRDVVIIVLLIMAAF